MPRHRVLTPLRWSDMDAYGHVNNVQFLRLLEDARVVAFAAAGSDEGGSVVDTGLLVARSEIEYVQPLVYRTAPVAIDLWVTRLAAASFDMGYEVLDDDPDDHRGEGGGDGGDGGRVDVGHEHGGHEHGGHDNGSGKQGRPRVYARAETTLVLFDRVHDRPRRMTAGERARLEAWQDGPVGWRLSRRR